MSSKNIRLDKINPLPPYSSSEMAASRNRRGWLYAAIPGFLFIGLTVVIQPRSIDEFALAAQAKTSATGRTVDTPTGGIGDGVWPVSLTYVIPSPATPAPSPAGAVLRSRLQKAVGVRGRAPLAGQVSRVLVKPGQRVAVDDKILEISIGPTTRGPSVAEGRQNAAESAQVRAVNSQEELQLKMMAAQKKLAAAQERVSSAQKRVEHARVVVRRLQQGETVAASEADAPVSKQSSSDKNGSANTNDSQQKKLRNAALAAQSAAEKAETRATVAENNADAADAAAKARERDAQEAKDALTKAQKNFDAGSIKASELDGAKAAAEDADAALKSAQTIAQSTRKKAASYAAAAKSARSNADKAGAESSKALKDIKIFAQDDEPGPTRGQARETSGGSLSIEQAARLVRAAVEESDAAAAEANSIKRQVDDYDRQVRRTREQLDSSSRQLESAQEQLLNQTIQANLSTVRSPANGVVLSVAEVAQEVKVGDVIITVGNGTDLMARWTDSTGVWRNLKLDQNVKLRIEPDGPAKTGGQPAPQFAVQPGFTVDARLTRLSPEKQGQPAVIEASISLASAGNSALREGMIALLMPVNVNDTAGPKNPVLLPPQAVLIDNSKPVAGVEGSVVGPGRGSSGQAAQVAVLHTETEARNLRIEWRRVVLTGSKDNYKLVSGLQPGERIALRPGLLRAMEERGGPNANLRLSSGV